MIPPPSDSDSPPSFSKVHFIRGNINYCATGRGRQVLKMTGMPTAGSHSLFSPNSNHMGSENNPRTRMRCSPYFISLREKHYHEDAQTTAAVDAMIKSGNKDSNKPAGMQWTSRKAELYWNDLFESSGSAEGGSSKREIIGCMFWHRMSDVHSHQLCCGTSGMWSLLRALAKSKNLILKLGRTNRSVLNINSLENTTLPHSAEPGSHLGCSCLVVLNGLLTTPGKTVSGTRLERIRQHSNFILSHLEKGEHETDVRKNKWFFWQNHCSHPWLTWLLSLRKLCEKTV